MLLMTTRIAVMAYLSSLTGMRRLAFKKFGEFVGCPAIDAETDQPWSARHRPRERPPSPQADEKKWLDPSTSRPITAHGFRTWAEKVATFPHAVVEQAMGHAVGTQVERAYRRTDVLEKRRALMEAWASFCEPKVAGQVIAFGKRG
jgi:hypothetical protein